MKKITFALSALLLSTSSAVVAAQTSSAPQEDGAGVSLHRLYCGDVHVSDLNAFSDTEAYTGQEKDLTVSCYVIQYGDKILLWDTGLSESIADMEGGVSSPPFTLTVQSKITDELKKIGLTPADITHVGLSHAHFDHAGNVNLFTDATLLIQEVEFNTLTQSPDVAHKHHMNPENLSFFLTEETRTKVRTLAGDEDVFGDGVLKAITLPGHTPGHMALKVTLPESGVYILSGDQWHFNENRRHNGVPTFNYNRADTLASSDKLEKIIQNTGATLIIQHEIKDISKTPALPEGLK